MSDSAFLKSTEVIVEYLVGGILIFFSLTFLCWGVSYRLLEADFFSFSSKYKVWVASAPTVDLINVFSAAVLPLWAAIVYTLGVLAESASRWFFDKIWYPDRADWWLSCYLKGWATLCSILDRCADRLLRAIRHGGENAIRADRSTTIDQDNDKIDRHFHRLFNGTPTPGVYLAYNQLHKYKSVLDNNPLLSACGGDALRGHGILRFEIMCNHGELNKEIEGQIAGLRLVRIVFTAEFITLLGSIVAVVRSWTNADPLHLVFIVLASSIVTLIITWEAIKSRYSRYYRAIYRSSYVLARGSVQ